MLEKLFPHPGNSHIGRDGETTTGLFAGEEEIAAVGTVGVPIAIVFADELTLMASTAQPMAIVPAGASARGSE